MNESVIEDILQQYMDKIKEIIGTDSIYIAIEKDDRIYDKSEGNGFFYMGLAQTVSSTLKQSIHMKAENVLERVTLKTIMTSMFIQGMKENEEN